MQEMTKQISLFLFYSGQLLQFDKIATLRAITCLILWNISSCLIIVRNIVTFFIQRRKLVHFLFFVEPSEITSAAVSHRKGKTTTANHSYLFIFAFCDFCFTPHAHLLPWQPTDNSSTSWQSRNYIQMYQESTQKNPYSNATQRTENSACYCFMFGIYFVIIDKWLPEHWGALIS